jgi:hypothetical protein
MRVSGMPIPLTPADRLDDNGFRYADDMRRLRRHPRWLLLGQPTMSAEEPVAQSGRAVPPR